LGGRGGKSCTKSKRGRPSDGKRKSRGVREVHLNKGRKGGGRHVIGADIYRGVSKRGMGLGSLNREEKRKNDGRASCLRLATGAKFCKKKRKRGEGLL